MFCPSCGNDCKEEWNVCPQCGKTLPGKESMGHLSDIEKERISEEEKIRAAERKKNSNTEQLSGCIMFPFKVLLFIFAILFIISIFVKK
jgi:uncharacterized membrane protein YvbJ